MRHKLYLKIYLAFLGITLLSIPAAGILSHVVRDRGPVPHHVHEAVELFAEDLEGPSTEQRLAERAERLGLVLGLYDSEGQLLAAAGETSRPRKSSGDHWVHGPTGMGLAVDLGDGRWLVSAPDREHAPGLPPHLLVLLPLALLMALGTYPVARGITRRIEALRGKVDELGSGDLGARVPVKGTDEVAALAHSFNRAADRIEALVEGQRRMLASASHELRSPLARLQLSVELAREAGTDEERDQHRAEALRNIEELDQLIEDLLLVGRLEAGERSKDEPVELLALAAEEAARADATVGGQEAIVAGDAALLRILLRNLLENANKHGQSPVEVTVEVSGDRVSLTVADAGCGVPESERERVFEPFYRPAERPEGDGGGTGLGLALVQRIARFHGGRAWCDPGELSRFVVELPLADR